MIPSIHLLQVGQNHADTDCCSGRPVGLVGPLLALAGGVQASPAVATRASGLAIENAVV